MANILPSHTINIDEGNDANKSSNRCSWPSVLNLVIIYAAVISAFFLYNNVPESPESPTGRWQRVNVVRLPYISHEQFHTALYSEQETHSEMLSTCNRIRNSQLTLEAWYGPYGSTKEKDFDVNIRAHENEMFGSGNKLMWTGCFYEYNKNETNCKTGPLDKYLIANFCDKTGWKKELKNLQSENTNPEKDRIHIIKDYGQPNACWKLFLPKQLTAMMGQTPGSIPRLPFACIFDNNVVYE